MNEIVPPPPPEITAKSGGGLIDKLWKERSTKGKVGVIFGAVVVLSIVAAAFGDADTESEATPASTVTEAPRSEPSDAPTTTIPEVASTVVETTTTIPAVTEDNSPVARLIAAVSKETGKTNIEGYGDRIQLVEWSQEQTLIRVLGTENLTSGLTKASNRRLVLDGIRAYQESGLSSEFIAIEVYFPLVDNLGAENLRRVLGYGFTQERISLIQTQNIDTKRMDTNFADEFTYVHPAFAW